MFTPSEEVDAAVLLECPHCQAKFQRLATMGGERVDVVQCPTCERHISARLSRPGRTATGVSTISSVPPQGPPPPAPVRRQGFEPAGNEKWFVLIGEEQCGPFKAAEMAQRLDSGAIDWTTAVWRDGFRDWRAARRDAVLVTSIAGERGFASDTVRLNSAGSFIAGEDTVVDRAPLPPMLDTGRVPGVAPSPPVADTPVAPAPNFSSDPPDARVSLPSSQPPPATLLRIGQVSLRLPHSLVSVAAVAFAAGVLAAALWARFLGPVQLAGSLPPPGVAQEPVHGEIVVEAPPAAAPEIEPGAALGDQGEVLVSAAADLAPVSAAEPDAPSERADKAADAAPADEHPLQAQVPSRELPKSQEIRSGVRTVAPYVRGCLANPKAGADVLIYLDGPSGRVRDVQVRRPRLGPVRVRCVVNAVRRLQLEPFRRDELVYPYKFAW